nr:hypothetical protein [uncultured Porphyromonas sp.]
MILLVFEGKKREPKLFTAIERLGLFKPGCIIYSFCRDIQSLYKEVKRLEGGADGTVDIVQILKSMKEKDKEDPIHKIKDSEDVSEIYLFFDTDLHNTRFNLRAQVIRIKELLAMFDDATGKGKLYISYPMIEALQYTKALPDKNFISYTIKISQSKKFKHKTHMFSSSAYKGYSSLEFLIPRENSNQDKIRTIRSNWNLIIRQHRSKAQRLCGISARNILSQRELFRVQYDKFIIRHREISILASMPLFLYDYFSEAKRKELGFSLAD